MVKLLLVVTAVVVLSVPVASQTQRKQFALRQTERDLIALSQKAVGTGVGSVDVTQDRFTGTTTIRRMCNIAELVDPHVTIVGDRAVVTGLVVFKCASSKPRVKENSSTVAIDFIKRDGKWRFAELCLGACGE
jgi:hypothetical protein